MKKNNLTFEMIAFIMLTDFLESAYEFFFKKGMTMVGEFNFSDLSTISEFLTNTISNGWIWIGLIIITLETLMWFTILSKIDLSIAFSIGSLSYFIVLLISYFFLHEHVGINRWIGTMLIILGIFLVIKSYNGEIEKTIDI